MLRISDFTEGVGSGERGIRTPMGLLPADFKSAALPVRTSSPDTAVACCLVLVAIWKNKHGRTIMCFKPQVSHYTDFVVICQLIILDDG